MITLYTLVIVPLALLAISYLVYPAAMRALKRKHLASGNQPPAGGLTVVLAAHNEAGVIAKRIHNLLEQKTTFPVSILVGSDCSTDHTDAILQELSVQHPSLSWLRMAERSGKAGVLNALVPAVKTPVVVFTDANVEFAPNCLQELAEALARKQVGLVGGTIHYQSSGREGIALEERQFMQFENQLKLAESSHGFCLGAEGGCMAMHTHLYRPLPVGCAVDDFYLTLDVLEQGHPVAFIQEAKAYEDHSPKQGVEYRRKVRISQGNFQNMKRFAPFLTKKFWPLGLAFWCHKGLRWIGPHLALLALVNSLLLGIVYQEWTFAVPLWGFLFIGLLDGLLKPLGFPHSPLRSINHFVLMNAALFHGWINYVRGNNSHVWNPTERNA